MGGQGLPTRLVAARDCRAERCSHDRKWGSTDTWVPVYRSVSVKIARELQCAFTPCISYLSTKMTQADSLIRDMFQCRLFSDTDLRDCGKLYDRDFQL